MNDLPKCSAYERIRVRSMTSRKLFGSFAVQIAISYKAHKREKKLIAYTSRSHLECVIWGSVKFSVEINRVRYDGHVLVNAKCLSDNSYVCKLHR